MQRVKSWATRHYLGLLLIIIGFSLITRVVRLDQPRDYIFDEVYHAVTVKLMARNDVRAYEWWNPPVEPNTAVDWLHPPLAKHTQAAFVALLGENPLAWRLSAALTGVLVIILTAKLAYRWSGDHLVSLLAAGLASLDGLLLVQSRIAMNDIHVAAAILAAMWLYLEFKARQPAERLLPNGGHVWRWWLASIAVAGLAMATKWSGLFAVLWIAGWEAWRTLDWLLKTARPSRAFFTKWLAIFVVTISLLPMTIYTAAYTPMFLQGKTLVCQGQAVDQGKCYCDQTSSWWVTALSRVLPGQRAGLEALESRGGCKRLVSHFSELHKQIWWYQTNLTATHDYQSRPWQWFFDLKPVWFHVKYYDDGRIANIYAFGNPAVMWGGIVAVLATVIFLVRELPKPRLSTEWWQLTTLLSAYLIVWLPWQFSPRIMFYYHYTPAVPLLCILLAWWLHRLMTWRVASKPVGRYIIGTYVATCLLAFVVWFPHWTGLPVSPEWMKQIYFVIPSWK